MSSSRIAPLLCVSRLSHAFFLVFFLLVFPTKVEIPSSVGEPALDILSRNPCTHLLNETVPTVPFVNFDAF